MRVGVTAQLRHSSLLVFLPSAVVCGHSLPLLASIRGFHGGAGRGDLLFTNMEARRHGRRALGQLRGVRHSGQTTAPESGQLHYRRLFLHAVGDAPCSGSGHHRHAASTWAYLVPSLLRCAESAVAEAIWAKLCRIEAGGGGCEMDGLSEHESHSVRSGQNIFRYELHQRLPLLEESVVYAELEDMLSWFTAARRAWLRLPVVSSSSATPHAESSDVCVSQTDGLLLPSRDVLSRPSTLSAAFRDTTPCRHQVFDMPMRLAQLTKVVIDRTKDELSSFGEGSSNENNKSARLIAKEKKFKQRFLDEIRWHRIII